MKNILFITSRNAATDILLERTMESANRNNLHINIEVINEQDGMARLQQNPPDLTLFSPSMRFYLNDRISKGLPEDAVIEVVDSRVYGSLDGRAMLETIAKGLGLDGVIRFL